MSLSEAVLEIIKQMDEDCGEGGMLDNYGDSVVKAVVVGYKRQLNTAVKAVEGAPQAAPVVSPFLMANGMGMAGAQNAAMIEAAKAEFREKKRKMTEALGAEGLGEDGVGMVLLVGGPLDGTHIQCPAEIPAGHKTNIDGAVYVIGTDRKAHFSEEESKKLAEQVEKKSKLIMPG